MKTRLITLLSVLLLSTSIFAQADKAKLDSYFAALEANNKFMGNVSVSKGGKTIYQYAAGFADADKGQKLNADSKFRIGSITKMFTAAMILKAAEEGKLKLEDNLSKYFPSVPNADKITIAQMLGHRSGIHNFTDDAEYLSWLSQPKTQAEMVGIIAKAKSDFTPDSEAHYSNSNYVLLSYILEKTYKKPYGEILEQKITKPLGLKNTYVGRKINPANNEAESYKYSGTWKEDVETDMSIPMGAGAIVSNTSDLSKFAEALFAGKVIKAENLDKMKTIRDKYGMGMFTFPFGDKTAYGHTGGIDSFRSMLSYFPEDNMTYVMTSNGSNYNNNTISIAVLSWALGQPFEIPTFTNYVTTKAELDQLTGTYASVQMPLKITIANDGTSLTAQATGQKSFTLDATAKNSFKFEPAGVVLEFTPESKEMVLKQGGGVFTFTRIE